MYFGLPCATLKNCAYFCRNHKNILKLLPIFTNQNHVFALTFWRLFNRIAKLSGFPFPSFSRLFCFVCYHDYSHFHWFIYVQVPNKFHNKSICSFKICCRVIIFWSSKCKENSSVNRVKLPRLITTAFDFGILFSSLPVRWNKTTRFNSI